MSGLSDAEHLNLVEELQIHRIELEIQNEELRNAQTVMEDNRDRYFSLFENAPVGYVILDHAGIIKQFNSAFADMFQIQSIKRNGLVFADLLSREDAAIFRARFTALFKSPSGKQIIARYKSLNGTVAMPDDGGRSYGNKVPSRYGSCRTASYGDRYHGVDPCQAEPGNGTHCSRTREQEIQGLLKGAGPSSNRMILKQRPERSLISVRN